MVRQRARDLLDLSGASWMKERACGYITSRYPSITHTFVSGEVDGLRLAGVRVETASVRQVSPDQLLSEGDRSEFSRTRALLPAGPLRLVRCHLGALAHSPLAYVSTLGAALRMAHAGGKPRLWQLFYFVEAMLLWDWAREHDLRHLRVHHANVAADVAMLACRFANAANAVPRWTWSITVHGPTELLDLTTHKLARKVADADAVICTSDFVHSQVAALLDDDGMGKVHTVRCGVDLALFSPRPDTPEIGEPQILCVAALSRRKGVAILIEAVALLRDRGQMARLRLVGDGPERPRLEALAARLGVADHIEFCGSVGNDVMAAAYRRARVFCLPSFAEGVPTVLIEAMAVGLPVVTTSIMGVPELVRDGVSGVLVAPHRSDELAAALEHVLSDPKLCESMGREGRATVEREFDRRITTQRLLSVLEPLL